MSAAKTFALVLGAVLLTGFIKAPSASDDPATLRKIQACLDAGGEPQYVTNGLTERIESWRYCDMRGAKP